MQKSQAQNPQAPKAAQAGRETPSEQPHCSTARAAAALPSSSNQRFSNALEKELGPLTGL